MKILVVAQDFPWPATGGTHLRTQQVVSAAAELGEVDLFSLAYPSRPLPAELPQDVGVRRLGISTYPEQSFSLGRRLAWLASPGQPLERVAMERDSIRVKTEFARFRRDRYDFSWVSKAMTFELLGRPPLGPTVVDLDDLEDRKIQARLDSMRLDRPAGGLTGRLHRLGAIAQARVNSRRWEAFQQGIARGVDRVVLCSTLDARRSGLPNVEVVPNGYDLPDRPAGSPEPHDPPTILMIGSYHYMPNADAARVLCLDVLPRLRSRVPDVQVRLVGHTSAVVERLHDPPGVTVVGAVERIEAELAKGDLVAVPLRYGSGTRVKILEAFAHRIPVVSSTLGAEGLGVENGNQLLLADSPDDFAQASARLLEEGSLRHEVTMRAHSFVAERYRWSFARDSIHQLVLELIEGSSRERLIRH